MEVIRVENLSKMYDLGQVGTGTLSKDLNRFWARVRGKEDPYARIGHVNDRTRKADKDESVWVLKDINFSVKQGEVVGIIGRNGAGKSTLLKIISRITTPTTGAIKIKGRVASLLEVGTGFHPEMTGRENVFMNGTLLGMTRREVQSKLDEIIDFAGVALYVDTPVKRYSSGMQVRLAFAVAAFLEPEILIVDEVLAVGDAEFQKKAIGRMQEVSKGDGRTVLFVSHVMQSVQTLCSRVVILDSGRTLFDGETSTGIEKYFIKKDAENVSGIWDLRSHPDKKQADRGIYRARFLRDGQPTTTFFTRDKFVVEIDFNDEVGIGDLVFGLVIKNKHGNPAIGISNLDLGKRLNRGTVHRGTVRFEINSLPIYGNDTYYIDLYFGDGGNNYDTLYEAISFHVKPIDIFGNGKLVSPTFTSIDPGFVTITLENTYAERET